MAWPADEQVHEAYSPPAFPFATQQISKVNLLLPSVRTAKIHFRIMFNPTAECARYAHIKAGHSGQRPAGPRVP